MNEGYRNLLSKLMDKELHHKDYLSLCDFSHELNSLFMDEEVKFAYSRYQDSIRICNFTNHTNWHEYSMSHITEIPFIPENYLPIKPYTSIITSHSAHLKNVMTSKPYEEYLNQKDSSPVCFYILADKLLKNVEIFMFYTPNNPNIVDMLTIKNLNAMNEFIGKFRYYAVDFIKETRLNKKDYALVKPERYFETVNEIKPSQSSPIILGYPFDSIQFTQKQVLILKKFYLGKSFKLIATELGISPRTVEHHLEHIRSKTNSVNNAMLKTELDTCPQFIALLINQYFQIL